MEAPVEAGQVVAGKYAVEEILGRGGVGLVVKAKHLALLEPCAIKFMLPEAASAPLARERFLREARACARLRSDHVVRVYDVGELDGETPYMVLEYLEGEDLHEHMAGRRLPVSEAAGYVVEVCAALAEAHALGIVHRDIKPENVFLARLPGGQRRVKLLDFGISKLLDEAESAGPMRTLAGTVMGTPSFMAPEQARGESVDARTDIWALGVLLYFLLTSELPFAGEIPTRTLALVLGSIPTPPSRHVPDLPPALEAVILKCLERDPDRRPSSVEAIASALAPFAAEERTTSLAASAPTPAPRASEKRAGPRWAMLAAAGACVAVTVSAAAIAPRAPEGAWTSSSIAPLAERAREARAQAATTIPAREPERALPAVTTASASAPSAAAPSAAAPTTAQPRPTPVVRSAGFDLGSRY